MAKRGRRVPVGGPTHARTNRLGPGVSGKGASDLAIVETPSRCGVAVPHRKIGGSGKGQVPPTQLDAALARAAAAAGGGAAKAPAEEAPERHEE